MELTAILVVLLSLQGICQGEALADPKAAHLRYTPPDNGLYGTPKDEPETPNTCRYSTKTVTTTIPVTETMTMSGITDTRTMPAETSFLNIPPVTTTVAYTSITTKPQVTNTIWEQGTTVSTLEGVRVTSTIPVYTTETLQRLTETTTVEKTIRETMMLVTSTVVRTSTVTEQPVVSIKVIEGFKSTDNLPRKTIISTVPIISTMEMPHCCTSTETTKMNVWTTLPADTTHYTPTVTATPITITRTKVITSHTYIKREDKTHIITTTETTHKKCGYESTEPSIPFTYGPTTTREFIYRATAARGRTLERVESNTRMVVT